MMPPSVGCAKQLGYLPSGGGCNGVRIQIQASKRRRVRIDQLQRVSRRTDANKQLDPGHEIFKMLNS